MDKKRISIAVFGFFVLFLLFQPFSETDFEILESNALIISGPTCPPNIEYCIDYCIDFGEKKCSGYFHYQICGNYDCDFCLEWSPPYYCGTGKICQGSGQCVATAPPCSNECSYYNQKTCSDSTHYKVCGDYDSDSCLEWSSPYYCGTGKTCSNGQCVTQCVSHSYKQCYNSDVYWYNSCGTREDKVSECGTDSWTSNYQCSGDWVQRQKVLKGCSGSSCYENTQWLNYQNCATQGKICQSGQCVTQCVSHSYKQCYNSDVYWYNSCRTREDKANECGIDSWTSNYQCSGDWVQRQKVLKGCSGSSCYENTQWLNYQNCATQGKICQSGQCVTQCVSHSYKQCYNSDVYWYNSCRTREDKASECGISGWSSDYQCSNSYLQRKYISRGCSSASCFATPEWRTDQNCGTDSWTSNYQCSGTKIQRQKHKQGCSDNSCYDYEQWEDTYDCADQGKVCQNAQCVIQCVSHSYKQCYNSDVYWYNSCGTREDKANECGVSGWSSDYQCSNSYLQRKYINRGCDTDVCFATPEWRTDQYCGTDSWTSNYQCSGTKIQRQKHKQGCSDNSCYDYEQWEDTYDCAIQGKTCSNGQCISECECNSWTQWQNQGCGQGNCSSIKMYQTRGRVCTPFACDTQFESQCIDDSSCQPTCQDECAFVNQTSCYDNNSKKTCGNYDSDSCLEWSSPETCGTDICVGTSWRDYYCSGGICSHNDISCHSNCYSCGDGTCDSRCGENQYNCSQDCGQSCQDECAFSGQVRCYNSTSKQTCGNYDSDSCLEWSSAQRCTGSTYCGYAKCDSDERPSWYCSGGICEYSCDYSSSCNGGYDEHDYRQCYNNDVYWYDSNNNRQDKYKECNSDYCKSWSSNYCSGGDVYKSRTCYDRGCSGSSCYSYQDTEKKLVERCDNDETCKSGKCVSECECTSGLCCDGCNYKEDTKICKTSSQTQYGCPWGTLCGADTGKRTRLKFQYCSGDSSDCDGKWGSWRSWGSWTVNDYCSNTEKCSTGDPTCNYSSSCVYTPSYNTKQCYDNDVYWFSQAGTRLSKYMECDDDNTCTLDRCGAGKCYYDLKCDGSTCGDDSSDYCASCEHCGDGVENCGEDFCSCSADCEFPGDVSEEEEEEEEEGIEGAAAIGGIFGRIVGIVGNVAFSIAMLFLLMLTIILFMISYYSFRKKRAEQFI